jgi:hypothetical protein
MTTDITRRSDATSTQHGSADARDEAESTLGSVADRAGAVADRAGAVADRAGAVLDRTIADARPIVAQAGSAIAGSTRAVGTSSDDNLAIGTATLTGLAIGLLIGGSNRLIVAAALLPATFMGYTLLARISGRSRKG